MQVCAHNTKPSNLYWICYWGISNSFLPCKLSSFNIQTEQNHDGRIALPCKQMVTFDDSVLGEAAVSPLEWVAATAVDAVVRISLIQCPAAVSTRTSSIPGPSDPDGNYNVSKRKVLRICSEDENNPNTKYITEVNGNVSNLNFTKL